MEASLEKSIEQMRMTIVDNLKLSLDPRRKSEFIMTTLVSLGYFAIAAFAIYSFGVNTPIWFANAIALAALVRHRPQAWTLILIGVAIADAGARFLFGGADVLPLTLAIWSTFCWRRPRSNFLERSR